MIKRIAISGFQSLDSVDLELDKITVIIGESRQGKSAVKRAMEGFVTNKPPRGHVSDIADKEDSVVVIETESGIVGWRKGKNNRYKIEGGQTFDKVGGSCPKEITEFLKMGEMDFGGTKLLPNFHGQFDKPFIVDEGGTVIAKIFGEATNIGKIIVATKEARSRKLDNTKMLSVRRDDLTKLETTLLSYGYLDGVKNDLKDLENVVNFWKTSRNLQDDLNRIYGSFNGLATEQTMLNEGLVAIKDTLGGLKDLETGDLLFSSKKGAQDTLIELKSMESALKIVLTNKALLEATSFEVNRRLASLSDLDGVNVAIANLSEKRTLLSYLKDFENVYKFSTDKYVDTMSCLNRIDDVLGKFAGMDDLGCVIDANVVNKDLLDDMESIERGSATLRNTTDMSFKEQIELNVQIQENKNNIALIEKELVVCPTCERPF